MADLVFDGAGVLQNAVGHTIILGKSPVVINNTGKDLDVTVTLTANNADDPAQPDLAFAETFEITLGGSYVFTPVGTADTNTDGSAATGTISVSVSTNHGSLAGLNDDVLTPLGSRTNNRVGANSAAFRPHLFLAEGV